MASTRLTRTASQNGTRTKYTFSFWIKRSGLSSGQSPIVSSDVSNSNNTYSMIYFVNDILAFYSTDNGQTLYFLTNQKFRDVNGWYHIVVAYDSPQATASNRVKMYVNGEQITSFDTASYPSQNADNTWFNRNTETVIGTRSYDNNTYFDGSMSHFHFCDGYAYSASDFGSTDSTTGEWKINTSPSVSYGTNGYFILKDGNSVTDQSGNSNNWTVGNGTLTKTEDNPSNVFATLNPLDNFYASSTFSHGNTNIVFNNSNECFNLSTLGMSSGKFYFEGKQISNGSAGAERNYFGISYSSPDASSDWLGNNNYSWGYRGDGKIYNSGQLQATYSSFVNNDIIGVALDLDNSKFYVSKNGTWQNSANPSNGTGGLSITANKTYFFAIGETTGGSGVESCVNFGNGYFKTVAVSSAGTNASGIGIFEYDVPTGYTALSTKGLNL